MANALERLEYLVERNQLQDHAHIIPDEARALHSLALDGDFDNGQKSAAILEAQKVTLGCVVCSATVAESSPGFVATNGRHAITG